MRDYLLKRPMLLSGIMCVLASVLSFYYRFSILFFPLIIVTVVSILIYFKSKFTTIIPFVLTGIVIISLLFSYGEADSLKKFNGKTIDCSAVIKNINYQNGDYLIGDAEIIESDVLNKGTKLSLVCYDSRLKMGDAINGKFYIEFVKDEKYRAGYYSEGIFLKAKVKSFVIKDDRQDFVLKTIGIVRNYIKDTLFSNLKYTNAATVVALILGDDSYLTNDFSLSIKSAGVSHIMVVSGMHLSVFVLAVTYFIEKFLYNRYLRGIIILAAVIFTVALCGFTPSVLRAGVTYVLMAVGLFLNRNGPPENSLGAAVTIILIISPFTALSIGFLLSVLATFGILAVATPVLTYIKNRNIIRNKLIFGLVSMVFITLSATLLTLPLTILVFGHISTVAVLSNLLISFAVSVVIWLAAAAIILNSITPFISELILNICEPVIEYINLIIKFFGKLKFAYIEVNKEWYVVAVFIIILIINVMLACKKRTDMVKLNQMYEKINAEGGNKLKWR